MDTKDLVYTKENMMVVSKNWLVYDEATKDARRLIEAKTKAIEALQKSKSKAGLTELKKELDSLKAQLVKWQTLRDAEYHKWSAKNLLNLAIVKLSSNCAELHKQITGTLSSLAARQPGSIFWDLSSSADTLMVNAAKSQHLEALLKMLTGFSEKDERPLTVPLALNIVDRWEDQLKDRLMSNQDTQIRFERVSENKAIAELLRDYARGWDLFYELRHYYENNELHRDEWEDGWSLIGEPHGGKELITVPFTMEAEKLLMTHDQSKIFGEYVYSWKLVKAS